MSTMVSPLPGSGQDSSCPGLGYPWAQRPCASWTSPDQLPGLVLWGHRCQTHQPGQRWVTTWVRVPWASGFGSPPRLPLVV